MKLPTLGKQPARFRFFLNPYTDVRFSYCPECQAKTRLRKLPLAIHVRPDRTLLLNKTCRYCPACDLLIAHRDEIAPNVQAAFAASEPLDWLVLGTVPRADWKAGITHPVLPHELPAFLHDFLDVVQFKMVGGWMPPPAS